jgi:hypothetical protein
MLMVGGQKLRPVQQTASRAFPAGLHNLTIVDLWIIIYFATFSRVVLQPELRG